MAENNMTVTADLKPLSMDFVDQYTTNVNKLLQILGGIRKTPLAQGSVVNIYKRSVDLADGSVAEGEVVPLSKVKQEIAGTKTIDFKKYARQVTIEAIQKSGDQNAIVESDAELLRLIQANTKKELLDPYVNAQNATEVSGADYQELLGKVAGQLAEKWEDYDMQSIAFVNPSDFSSYMASNHLDTQVATAFGLSYLQGRFGFGTIIETGGVPAGTVVATATNNVNAAYAIMNGSIGSAFDFTTDQTGLIGVTHTTDMNTVGYRTTVVTSLATWAERQDGIIVGKLSK